MTTATGAYATAAAMKTLAGISDSADDALIALICDRVNQYIESRTLQPIAPIASAAYTYDGDGLTRLFAPIPAGPTTITTKGIGGFRAVTVVEIAPITGGTYETLAAGDYFLRDRHGILGPYRYLTLSDVPAGSYRKFPVGRATVRVTATAGWTAIPDDLTDCALVIAQRAWNARQVGYQDTQGPDEFGMRSVARFVSGRDKETLKKYTLKWP